MFNVSSRLSPFDRTNNCSFRNPAAQRSGANGHPEDPLAQIAQTRRYRYFDGYFRINEFNDEEDSRHCDVIVMYIHMAFMHRLGGDREDDGRLQRRGPAQRVHRGGDVRDPWRTRLHPRGGPAGRSAKALRQQEARDQIGLQAGLSPSPLVSLCLRTKLTSLLIGEFQSCHRTLNHICHI